MTRNPWLMAPEVDGALPVTLTVGDTELEVLPRIGLVCSSLTVAGQEFLHFDGVAAVLDGHTSGIPLLAPWANRLGGPDYVVGDRVVPVLGAPGVHVDDAGLPIHGTMVGREGWEVDPPMVSTGAASMVARFDAAAHPEVMASFPFPHTLSVEYRLERSRLTVTTTMRATGSTAVPVSFGWHPYLTLPGTSRDDWSLELPDRFHLALDHRRLPTGEERFEPSASIPLAGREFDDGYRLGTDRELGLTDGRRRLTVGLGEGYSHAQVYAPIASDLVALEPMTAATDALPRGATRFLDPGRHHRAVFTISIL